MDRLGDHRLRCYGFEIKEKHAELEPFVGTRMYFVVHPNGACHFQKTFAQSGWDGQACEIVY